MKKNQTSTIKSNKRLVGILISIPILLSIPLIAMQFTNEVKWTLLDFIVAGVLLISAGISFELVLRKVKTIKLRILVCVILFILFFLIWAELAVDIFGTPLGGN